MFINFYQILVEILSLTKEYKKKYLLLILFFLTIVASFFEILTIGSLIPLMEVLINPNEYISNSNYFIKKIIPLADESDLRKIILIFFSLLIIFSYLFKILILWMSAVVTFDISLFLNDQVFENNFKKYKYFSHSHTSSFISNQEKLNT